jgi:hypothetical protein
MTQLYRIVRGFVLFGVVAVCSRRPSILGTISKYAWLTFFGGRGALTMLI